jgi:hypothetical protein
MSLFALLLEAILVTRVDWRYTWKENGEQSAIEVGTMLILEISVAVWDIQSKHIIHVNIGL